MAEIAEIQVDEVPRMRLNMTKLHELRRANGLGTDAELARYIGIDPASLYRYGTGKGHPSNQVIARIKQAFPLVSLDDLVIVEGVSA